MKQTHLLLDNLLLGHGHHLAQIVRGYVSFVLTPRHIIKTVSKVLRFKISDSKRSFYIYSENDNIVSFDDLDVIVIAM